MAKTPIHEIRSLLVDAAWRHGLIGAAVAVVRADAPPEFECVGMADRRTNRAVDPASVFRIASISKTMTAIGIMQLRDEGRLDLDDPVNRYLKTFTVEPPPGGADVTFRHLLTHTAGIGELPRVADIVQRRAWGIGAPGAEPAVLATIYRGALHTDVPAGAKWAYANHGFAVLGQTIEDITGEPFATRLRDRLFAPLAMTDTGYLRRDVEDASLATGSHWVFGRLRDVKDYDLTLLAPGSARASVADMARYAEWLLRSGGSIPAVLKADTVAEMMEPQFSVHPGFPGMGLAFWLDHLGPHRTAGHDGDVPGFASSLLLAPDAGVGVVVLTNTATFFGAHRLGLNVLRALLDVPDPATTREGDAIPERPHLWPDLIGHYAPAPGFLTNARVWQMTSGEIDVAIRSRRLVVRAHSVIPQLRDGVTLHATDHDDPTRFVAEFDGLLVPVAFRLGPQGRATSVVVGPPSNSVFHRRSALRSSRVRLRAAGVAASVLAVRQCARRRT